MITLRVSQSTINQIGEVARKARVARGRLTNRQEPLNRAKDYMVQRWDVNFSSQGGIYGGWPALSDWAAASQPRGPILVRTGALWAHFAEENEAGQVDSSSVNWIMSNMDGAWTVSHHDGYPNPIQGLAPIPSRILWDFNGEDEDEIAQYFEEWLSREIEAIF